MQLIINNIRVFIVLMLFLSSNLALAQPDGCREILGKANSAYKEGRYEKVVELLKDRIETCNFDKMELEQAKKLLSASYIKLDELELANEEIYSLLKKNPTYQIQPMSDPFPFVEALSNFEQSPRLKLGVGIGRFQPFMHVDKAYPVFNVEGYSSEYNTESSFSFHAHIQYIFNKKFSVSIDPMFTIMGFKQKISYPDIVTLSYSENSGYFKIPVTFNTLVYRNKSLSILARAGLYQSSLLGTSSELSYKLSDNAAYSVENLESIQRNKSNFGYQFGVKLQYNRDRLCFSANANYGRDLKLYNLPDSRYTNSNLLFDYNYVSDDIKMSHLDLNLAISYIFLYKVKQKHRLR